jgi:hypothetical protein
MNEEGVSDYEPSRGRRLRETDECSPTAVIIPFRTYKRAGEKGYGTIQAALAGRSNGGERVGTSWLKNCEVQAGECEN